jgi:hypothetical protein
VVDAPSGEMTVQRLAGSTSVVSAFCGELPAPVRVAYEAGPTGFELARALTTAGVACVVAAPGKIERPATDRVKTDRRDAERLVRLPMIGGLHPVRVPTSEEEALRDLEHKRERRLCGLDPISVHAYAREQGVAHVPYPRDRARSAEPSMPPWFSRAPLVRQ